MADQPNIVFMLADNIGWGDLSCYGSLNKTPRLDRLASEGIRFTNHNTEAQCTPTPAKKAPTKKAPTKSERRAPSKKKASTMRLKQDWRATVNEESFGSRSTSISRTTRSR